MIDKINTISLNDYTPYVSIDLMNEDVNFIVKGRGERRKALKTLKEKFPVGSVVGITLQDKPVEVWILEWNYVANPNNSSEYIIGGRAVSVEDNTAYLLKPVKIE